MKKIAILLGAVMVMASASFACDGKKEKNCCSKEKQESCHKDKKDKKMAAAQGENGKACCSKGEHKSASNVEMKKSDTKEVKAATEVKKS